MIAERKCCGVPTVGFRNGLNDWLESFLQDTSPLGLRERVSFPLSNVDWDDTKVNLTFEIPGVDKSDIQIHVEGDLVTVEGEKKLPYSGKVLQSERYAGKFLKKIRLPYLVELNATKATFKNGVLSLTLLRKEETKPKTIEISIE